VQCDFIVILSNYYQATLLNCYPALLLACYPENSNYADKQCKNGTFEDGFERGNKTLFEVDEYWHKKS
jgi:hypothetical protein